MNVIEKSRLQREARQYQQEIASGTLGPMEKMKNQKAWRAVMLKLKANPTPVKGEDEDDEDDEGTDDEALQVSKRSLVGLELAGVKHPAWTKVYEKSSKVSAIVSNEQLGVVVLWSPETGTKRSAFCLGWPLFSPNQTTSADNAWAGVKSYFPADKRKKVRYMVEQAIKAAEEVMKNGARGFTVAKDLYNCISLTKGRTKAIGSSAIAPALADAHARWRVGELGMAEVGKLAAEGEQEAALSALRNAITTASMDSSRSMPAMSDLDQLVESMSDEQRDWLSAPIASTRTSLSIALGQKGEPPASSGSGADLIARYQAGEFSNESYEKFRQRIVDVDQAGAELDVVKEGAIAWVEANEELFQAAA